VFSLVVLFLPTDIQTSTCQRDLCSHFFIFSSLACHHNKHTQSSEVNISRVNIALLTSKSSRALQVISINALPKF